MQCCFNILINDYINTVMSDLSINLTGLQCYPCGLTFLWVFFGRNIWMSFGFNLVDFD